MASGFPRGYVSSRIVRDVIARVGPSIAEVVVQTPGGWVPTGTAFAISSTGILATCAHVIGEGTLALNFSGSYSPAIVLEKRDALDLALLKIDRDTPALTLSAVEEIQVGDQVLWGGYPLDSALPSWHQGMVSFVGPLPVSPGPKGVQLDGTVNRGNSGGPIINPDTCAVVGMVTSKVGGLPEQLRESLAKLMYVGDFMGGGGSGIRFGRGDVSVNPNHVLLQTIQQLERGLQLGIGYGISAEYIANLKASVAS